nr:hypothetical protein [Simonsiella muelleri]
MPNLSVAMTSTRTDLSVATAKSAPLTLTLNWLLETSPLPISLLPT